ncbi:MAG: substrate-binding domain-containing protein [Betaproteobacteria bacterium]
MGGSVTLALVDPENPFQQLLKADAEAAARLAGLSLRTLFTTESLSDHLGILRRVIQDPGQRPDALLVLAVRDQGLGRVIREAAAAGVHWLLLNAVEDDLDAIRSEYPAVVVATVSPDEIGTGKLQGRQMRVLARPGGRVLYVQGNPRSLTSRQRTEGMQQATAGAGFDVLLGGGDWNPEQAGRTVREWLRFAVPGRRPFDLVTCQNDHLAGGVLEALAATAAEAGRPELAQVPVTGCDGTPDFGQKMVSEGRLAATVKLPRVAGPALEIVGRLLSRGERPAPVVLQPPESFPPLEELRPSA